MSLHNWDEAVIKATQALEDERKAAGATALDPIPGGQFYYVTILDKSASVHRQPRKLIFDIWQRSTVLCFADAQVVLEGLDAYAEEWRTGDRGSPRDQVRMCRFDLYQIDEEDLIANGTVGLLIPSADNGPPVYVSSV